MMEFAPIIVAAERVLSHTLSREARLEAFISTAEEFNHLPALRGVASQLLELLQKIWPEMRPLPLYPAFLRALSE